VVDINQCLTCGENKQLSKYYEQRKGFCDVIDSADQAVQREAPIAVQVNVVDPIPFGVKGAVQPISKSSMPMLSTCTEALANAQIARVVTWIPTVKNMLEDALLMSALYIWSDEELRDMARRNFKNKRKNWVELYKDIEPEHLQEEKSHFLFSSIQRS
jgi:hypothetical protein